MDLRPLALAAAAAVWGPAASAASWHAVPGSASLEVDLHSAQPERSRVTVWLRWSGSELPLPSFTAHAPRATPAWRTSVQAEFDCSRRTLRVLAASGYDRAGTPLFMSSVPGAAVPVPGGDFGWAYDAVCEAARTLRF